MTDARNTRKFRVSTYNIRNINRSGDEKGEIEITVDGKAIDGNVILADRAPAEHEVLVTIG